MKKFVYEEKDTSRYEVRANYVSNKKYNNSIRAICNAS